VLTLGLVANEATLEGETVVGGNDLDRALWTSTERATAGIAEWKRVAQLPFDHVRQLCSALADGPTGRALVVKGAPEAVLARCKQVPAGAQALLDSQFASGSRVVAVASRPAPGLETLTPTEERDLDLCGFLCFADRPKANAAASLKRLAKLGVIVKVVTGDNGRVAEKVCGDLGLVSLGTLTGSELAAMSDEQLAEALPRTSIFARVTPEQKSRIIRAQRVLHSDVGFLGDGVNDAIALHDADVGISVDTAADVAKDAADIVLMAKDLGILADGVVEGRRIFANTIKYVLMGTSSNFGNMFSAAGASLLLKFLPMLPAQILLNNLLYDFSELTIPTDEVDEEMLGAAVGVGHPLHPPLHGLLRADQLSLRFPHLRSHDLALPRRADAVSLRLVRRVADHADARHLCHSHAQGALLPQPAQHTAAWWPHLPVPPSASCCRSRRWPICWASSPCRSRFSVCSWR
jgi:Mg2+-importing ATPase